MDLTLFVFSPIGRKDSPAVVDNANHRENGSRSRHRSSSRSKSRKKSSKSTRTNSDGNEMISWLKTFVGTELIDVVNWCERTMLKKRTINDIWRTYWLIDRSKSTNEFNVIFFIFLTNLIRSKNNPKKKSTWLDEKIYSFHWSSYWIKCLDRFRYFSFISLVKAKDLQWSSRNVGRRGSWNK